MDTKNRRPPPADEEDDPVYKPDMEDLDPPLGDIEQLDLDELIEGRDSTDTWTSLKYLTELKKRKSVSNHELIPIKKTPHELQYISYLNRTYVDKEDGQKKTYLAFLEKNRIELNTIMTQIGAKRFWNWLYAKILGIFPTRNYTRVIPVPPYDITLEPLDKLNGLVEKWIADTIHDETNQILNELCLVEGLLNVDAKQDEINDRLQALIDADEEITKFTKKVERLIKSSFNTSVAQL